MSDNGIFLRCRSFAYDPESGEGVISDSAQLNVLSDVFEWAYQSTGDDRDEGVANIPVSIAFAEPWIAEFDLLMEGDAFVPAGMPILRNGSTATSRNWVLYMTSTSNRLLYLEVSGANITSTITFPADEFVPVKVGWDGTNLFIEIDGVRENGAPSTYNPTQSTDRYAVFSSTEVVNGMCIANISITENDGDFRVFYPCNEGSGLVWTELEQGYNGVLTSENIHKYIGGEGLPPVWLEIPDVTIFRSEADTYVRDLNQFVINPETEFDANYTIGYIIEDGTELWGYWNIFGIGALSPSGGINGLTTSIFDFVIIWDNFYNPAQEFYPPRTVTMFGQEWEFTWDNTQLYWSIESTELAGLIRAGVGDTVPVTIEYGPNANGGLIGSWTNTGNGAVTQRGLWTPETTTPGTLTSQQTVTNETGTTQGDEWNLIIEANTAEYDAYFTEWEWTSDYGLRLGPRPVAAANPGDGTFWISPTGTGTGRDIDDPAEIVSGLGAVVPGDVVFFRGGTYDLPLHATRARIAILGGTESEPIIYESYPGEMAIIDGRNMEEDPEDPDRGGWQFTEQYATMRRVIIQNMPHEGLSSAGDNNTVEGIVFRYNTQSGFNTTTVVPDNTLVIDCASHGNSDADLPSQGNNADGIAIPHGTNTLVQNCWSYENSDDGFDTWSSTGTRIVNCISTKNDATLGAAGGGTGYKCGIGAGTVVTNSLAAENLVGFSGNSSPDVKTHNCTSVNNITSAWDDFTEVTNSIKGNGEFATNIDTETNNSWQRGDDPTFISETLGEEGFLVPTPGGGYDDIGAFVERGRSDEVQDVLDRMSALSPLEEDAIADFVDSQVDSGNWALIDDFFCFLLNEDDWLTGWKMETATVVGDVVKTPDGASMLSGVGNYIDTNLDPGELTQATYTRTTIGQYLHSFNNETASWHMSGMTDVATRGTWLQYGVSGLLVAYVSSWGPEVEGELTEEEGQDAFLSGTVFDNVVTVSRNGVQLPGDPVGNNGGEVPSGFTMYIGAQNNAGTPSMTRPNVTKSFVIGNGAIDLVDFYDNLMILQAALIPPTDE